MTKKEKAQFVQDKLEELYPEVPVALDHTDPYTLLVAVLLSAQCTDKRVNLVTPHLFKMASNPYDMVKMSVEEIREIIRPCGLSPSKSKGIYGLSQRLIEEHNGEVPADMEYLETLPAVGHKTASVVMSQAFEVPAFPVLLALERLAAHGRVLRVAVVRQLGGKIFVAAAPVAAHGGCECVHLSGQI